MSDRLKDIRERHNVTLFIDWEKEIDPEWQPRTLSNVQLCHKDRGELLDMIDEKDKRINKLEVKLDEVVLATCAKHSPRTINEIGCPYCQTEQAEAQLADIEKTGKKYTESNY